MSAHQQQDPKPRALAEILLELSRDLGFGVSRLERSLTRVTEVAAAALAVDRCSVWRMNEDQNLLNCLDLFEAGPRRHTHDLGVSISDFQGYFEALETSRIIAAEDAARDERTAEFADTYFTPLGIKSLLDAPVRLRGQVVGVICLEQTSKQRHWTAEEATFAASLGDLLATIFEASDHEKLQRHFLQSQKLEAVGRLAGGVAHDFNNLLTAIRGNVDLVTDVLRSHPAAGRDVQAEMNHMIEAIDRAAALTRQLLAFGGRQNRGSEVFNANDIVLAMQSMLARLLPESIYLSFELDEKEATICADPTLIEQILLNLVLNARDALKEGGCLWVRSSRQGAPGQPAWILEVKDDGVGISPELQQLIYEPFFTTKEEGKGSGLGLSTVLGIVKSLGGQLHLDSQPGHGSTFRVQLPLKA